MEKRISDLEGLIESLRHELEEKKNAVKALEQTNRNKDREISMIEQKCEKKASLCS